MNKDFNTSVEREREMFVGSLSILLVLMSPIQWNYVMQTTASPFSFVFSFSEKSSGLTQMEIIFKGEEWQ
jgi:hypothetical protein